MTDHVRALDMGYDSIRDRFNRDPQYRRHMYYYHLQDAEFIVQRKMEVIETFPDTRKDKRMDYASRVQIFGSKMVIRGAARYSRTEDTDRHLWHGTKLRKYLRKEEGLAEFPEETDMKQIKEFIKQPGIPKKGEVTVEAADSTDALAQSTRSDASQGGQYSQAPPSYHSSQSSQDWQYPSWWGWESDTPQNWQWQNWRQSSWSRAQWDSWRRDRSN
jgi:hypothetical protein